MNAHVWMQPAALIAASLWFLTGAGSAQTLSGEALVKALRQGGYVIVMRHASSPPETATKQRYQLLS